MRVYYGWIVEKFLQRRIGIALVNEHFADAFAIFSEGFERQRLSAIFLRKPAVANKRRA